MPDKVRCKDCGLLSIRDARDSLIYPADERVRDHGVTRSHTFEASGPFGFAGRGIEVRSDKLICYVGYHGLTDDLAQMRNKGKAIGKERSCPHFTAWVPGKTPKEHEEMTILEQVRAEQATFRNNEEERRVEWRRQDRNISIAIAAGTVLSALVAIFALWVSLSR